VADSVLEGPDSVVELVNYKPMTLGARGRADSEGADHGVTRHSARRRELGRGSRRVGAPAVAGEGGGGARGGGDGGGCGGGQAAIVGHRGLMSLSFA
jgi:hypothetical protein